MDALFNHSFDSIIFADPAQRFDSLVGDDEPNFDLSFLGPDFERSIQTVDPKIVESGNNDPSFTPVIPPPDSSNTSSQISLVSATSVVSPSLRRSITISAPRQEPESSVEPPKAEPPRQKPKRKTSKSYHCPECSYNTSNLKRLGDHMRDIHKIQAFKCDNCETRVTRYDNLESHKRTCGKVLAFGSSAAPNADSSSRTRPAKRQRVCLRNLQPVPLQPLPLPTSPYASDTAGLSNITSNQNKNRLEQQNSQSPGESKDIGLGFNGSYTKTKTTTEWALEVETLKSELSKARRELKQTIIERDVWKLQFLDLKQEIVYLG